jgi:hypothetical protein
MFEGLCDQGSAMFFLLDPTDSLLTSDKSQPLQATGTRVSHVLSDAEIEDSLEKA